MKSLIPLLAALCLPLSAQTVKLDGATGHVFKFDAEGKTFELLKETEYDPKTETARSRFTVHWTEDTIFTKVTEPASFAGIKQPLYASFQNLDDRNARALKAGEDFEAPVAVLYRNIVLETEVQDFFRKVEAPFTPDAGEAPLSGIIDVNGKKIRVSMKRRKELIRLHENLTAADLAKGFWQTTIHGEETDGRFVIRSMTATPLPDPLATDDPKLPRVLIIGDSISMNYFDAAKAELKGIANLHRNEGNAGSSTRGVLNTELWLGNFTEKGRHWDVIQFNHGLHDLKQTYDAKTDTWGEYSVPMEDYQANLEKQITILKKTGAKLIWCATTPVPNSNKGEYARRKGACVDFNKAALEVMAKHPEIRINDLHGLVSEATSGTSEFLVGSARI